MVRGRVWGRVNRGNLVREGSCRPRQAPSERLKEAKAGLGAMESSAAGKGPAFADPSASNAPGAGAWSKRLEQVKETSSVLQSVIDGMESGGSMVPGILDSYSYLTSDTERQQSLQLKRAVQDGNVDRVRRLLASNASPDGAWPLDCRSPTPLMAACNRGDVECARLLLDAKAGVHHAMSVDDFKQNVMGPYAAKLDLPRSAVTAAEMALIDSPRQSHAECLELVMQHDERLHGDEAQRAAAAAHYQSLLWHCMHVKGELSRVEHLKLLLAVPGVDPNARMNWAGTMQAVPLVVAVMHGSAAPARELMRARASPTLPGEGVCALRWAFQFRRRLLRSSLHPRPHRLLCSAPTPSPRALLSLQLGRRRRAGGAAARDGRAADHEQRGAQRGGGVRRADGRAVPSWTLPNPSTSCCCCCCCCCCVCLWRLPHMAGASPRRRWCARGRRRGCAACSRRAPTPRGWAG